jgi:dihydroorotate dehydrogenase
MAGLFDRLARDFLFRFDPEIAHRMAIRGLSLNVHASAPAPDPILRARLFDLDLPSPVGLAAGFDKNGEAIDGLLRLGFGFVEVGTVTPLPQPGNPKPRMFRLEPDRAIINRLGFNNHGAPALLQRLRARGARPGVVGVNLGANKDSADRAADYVAGINAFAGIAGYLTMNVSSPNTPGLRNLQERGAIDDLLRRAVAARDQATAGGRRTPLLVKLAPDLDDGQLAAIAEAAVASGVDGVILTNTTLSRDGLKDITHSAETGGLSGRPLFRRSTILLARFRRLVGSGLTLIGVGGIETAENAWDKLAAGANLVQVYSGMIYEGHRIAADINRGLTERLRTAGVSSVAAVVGTETERWAGARP